MKKRLYIMAILFTLLMSGCAQKEIGDIEVDDKGALPATTVSATTTNATNGYENVDLYGQNSGGYTQDDSYDAMANSGIENIYFDVDQYIITPDKLPIIINNARILSKAVQAGSRVKIEGHCDATGTDEYNYALGLRRAKAAKEALVSRGINPSAITIVSMGESSPLCTTDYSSACYAKNRRVEFKIIQ
ncbi:MAG: OmpA family protein [Epsilonproteobacteria bacterium]|nr:OmpA family protein [Campylobacterota bacterium]